VFSIFNNNVLHILLATESSILSLPDSSNTGLKHRSVFSKTCLCGYANNFEPCSMYFAKFKKKHLMTVKAWQPNGSIDGCIMVMFPWSCYLTSSGKNDLPITLSFPNSLNSFYIAVVWPLYGYDINFSVSRLLSAKQANILKLWMHHYQMRVPLLVNNWSHLQLNWWLSRSLPSYTPLATDAKKKCWSISSFSFSVTAIDQDIINCFTICYDTLWKLLVPCN